MTPEQLKKGTRLEETISRRKNEIEKYECSQPTKYGAITFDFLNNSNHDCQFCLKSEQIKMIEGLVVATAKSNLDELKKEFENI